MVSPSGVNSRPVPFASSETTQMTGMAHIFIKFVEGAVVYAGRQSYCSESSKSRSGLTRTSENSAKTKPKSYTGTGQPTGTVQAGGALAG